MMLQDFESLSIRAARIGLFALSGLCTRDDGSKGRLGTAGCKGKILYLSVRLFLIREIDSASVNMKPVFHMCICHSRLTADSVVSFNTGFSSRCFNRCRGPVVVAILRAHGPASLELTRAGLEAACNLATRNSINSRYLVEEGICTGKKFHSQ